jgi:hypothetical protein
MTDREWQQFFTLLSKIVNMPNLSANEKKAEFLAQVSEQGGETDLGEFVAWFGGEFDG